MLYIFISTYVFALQSRFYNPVKRTLFNAFFMPCAICFRPSVSLLDVLTAAAAYFGVFFLPQVAMLKFCLISLIAFINYFYGNLQKYMPKKEEHMKTDMVSYG
ncbi:MAG: hypothetical protein ACLVG5_11495 [Clostridium sp.]